MPDLKKLYLIPTTLGSENIQKHSNISINNALCHSEFLIVENAKPARQFIKSLNLEKSITDFNLTELSKNAENHNEINELLSKVESAGFMSDAGLPCVADPGNLVVNIARKQGFRIVPLVGPSSIMLALMASGFNGQQFSFHGYLPYNETELMKQLTLLENEVIRNNYTQIFIETPYRNDKLFQVLLKKLHPETKLCLAINLLQDDEFIDTVKIAQWKTRNFEIGKRPAIFLIGK